MPTMDARKSSIETDPVRNFKFLVRINHPPTEVKGIERMGFMNVSGLAMSTEVIPYREGGNNTTQRKMPGQSSFSDITLSRGVVFGNNQPFEWTRQIFSANAGKGWGDGATDFRTNIDIFVLAHPVTGSTNPPAYVKFKIWNAWIAGLSFSELDAGSNAVMVQQMTLTHEGYSVSMSNTLGRSASNVTSNT